MKCFHHLCIFLTALLLLAAGCQSQKSITEQTPFPPPALKENPDSVKLITSDIDLFWTMYDLEKPLFTKMEVDSLYFDAGTRALSLFHKEKIKSTDAFANLLNNRFDRRYYEKVRSNTMQINQYRNDIITALRSFANLYPEAVFTDIVFIIGGLDTGGTLLTNGQVVIAAEMFAKPPEMDVSYLSPWLQSVLRTPDALPVIILHELVHLQQHRHAAPAAKQTLLDRAILEGSADFITHLLLGNFLTEALHAYAAPREQALWRQFSKQMNRQDFTGWLYNGNDGSDRPADLGYYIGFRIAEAYYNNAADKQQAIRDMIRMENGTAFLEKSGYTNSF